MNDFLPPWPLLSGFLVASLLLALMPGPGVLYIVAHSVARGRRGGLLAVAGIAVGNLGNALAAAVGLAALFEMFESAFVWVKMAGALYLVYLGVRMLRAAPRDARSEAALAPVRRLFAQGVLVALLNPKTTLFFAAFIPQFLLPGPHFLQQSLALGALFVGIAAATDTLYAWLAGALTTTLQSPRIQRLGQRWGGGMLVGLGVFTAWTGERATR